MARLNKKAGINPALVRKRRLTALAFLLPNLIGFLLFTLIPVMTAFVLSFMAVSYTHLPGVYRAGAQRRHHRQF